MKILVFVSAVLPNNSLMLFGSERLPSMASSAADECVVCASLRRLPTEEKTDGVEQGSFAYAEEMGVDAESRSLCTFCKKCRVGEKAFTCGHCFPSTSSVGSTPNTEPCPPCKLYSAVAAGDCEITEAMLTLCKGIIKNVVFASDSVKKSLIHVATQTSHFEITVTILLFLIADRNVDPKELVRIVEHACIHTTGYRWEALYFVVQNGGPLPCTDATLFRALSQLLSDVENVQAVTAGFDKAKKIFCRWMG